MFCISAVLSILKYQSVPDQLGFFLFFSWVLFLGFSSYNNIMCIYHNGAIRGKKQRHATTIAGWHTVPGLSDSASLSISYQAF